MAFGAHLGKSVAFSALGHISVKHGAEKFLKTIVAAERSRNSNPTAGEGQERQHNQRDHHHPWTFMNPAMPMSVWRGRPRPRVVVIAMAMSQIFMRLSRSSIFPKKRH